MQRKEGPGEGQGVRRVRLGEVMQGQGNARATARGRPGISRTARHHPASPFALPGTTKKKRERERERERRNDDIRTV